MTFYMLGILIGGDPNRVRESARHVAGPVSDNYRGDACTFYESMLENQALRKNFKSNLCRGSKCTHEIVHEYMDNPRILNLDNIHKAAAYFVEKMLHVSPTDKYYRNANFLLQKSYRKRFTKENRSCTEQLILNLAIPASDRLAIFSSMDRNYEAAGVPPRYKYNNTTEIPTNVSTLPKTAILSKATMGDLISSNIQQPANQFILIELYEEKPDHNNYRLRDKNSMRTSFFKLTGKHLVYATFRLYHELASLSVHDFNYQHNDWSYNTSSDFNLRDNVSMITRSRYHHKRGPQLRYFAICLTKCHNSYPDQFHAAHPNWVCSNAKKPKLCRAHENPQNVPLCGPRL
jgi:hypothetical protein